LSAAPRASALVPFKVRSFRFQWPADLATSWAFEMETLILGWYVLVETRSVLMLTIFASLQYSGNLLAPMVGVMADRLGHRNVLCAMRSAYVVFSSTLMVLSFAGALAPTYVLLMAGVMGMVRPSDTGIRSALVGMTMPSDSLVGAMSIQRTTQDTARIAGALSGAGLMAWLGMGPAYALVVCLYVTSVLLTLKAGSQHSISNSAVEKTPVTRPSPWRELREGVTYAWHTPHVRAVMLLALMLNMTAFPLFGGLLPYVAKEVYHANQTMLGYMVATAASGALTGSIILSRFGSTIQPARMMIVFCVMWYSMLIVFAQMQHPPEGILCLFLAGLSQSLGQVPMAALLLRNSDARFRGRIMGIRMLAIYSNVPGLLLAAPLISRFGYSATAALYCVTGITVTLLIAVHWRSHLLRGDAPANRQ